MSITHTFVSSKSDGGDSTLVKPSDWNADHTIASGYYLPRVITVPLNNDDIIHLPNTAIELIAHPGANKVIVPFAAWLRLDWHADYMDIDPTCAIHIRAGVDYLELLEEASLSSISGLLAGGGPDGSNALMYPYHRLDTGGTHTVGSSGYYDSDISDLPLQIFADNGAVNFSGGDPANVLSVTVYYVIQDL